MSDPEFELTDELASFIVELHDSEINGEISWFFGNVWNVKRDLEDLTAGKAGVSVISGARLARTLLKVAPASTFT